MASHETKVLIAADLDHALEPDGSISIQTADRSLRVRSVGLSRLLESLASFGTRLLSKSQIPESLSKGLADMLELRLAFELSPAAAACIDGADDERLYTYFARRTKAAAERFIEYKRTRLRVVGNAPLSALVVDAIRGQYPAIVYDEHTFEVPEAPNGEATITLVVGTPDEEAAFRRAGAVLASRGADWVPLIFSDTRVQVGPWCRPGQSACLECGHSAQNPQVLPAKGDFRAASAPLAWRSTQQHARSWWGGVLLTQLEGLRWQIGEFSHWGRVTTLDLSRSTQEVDRLWRAPWCAACRSPSPAPQRWSEA